MSYSFKMEPVIVLVTLSLSLVLASDKSVHIYNQYPDERITSSTLRWTGASKGYRPDSAVVASIEIVPAEDGNAAEGKVTDGTVDAVKERPIHVCRGWQEGLWVPGLLRSGEKECQASLLGRVFSYSTYEVLENVETGARLSWAQWGRNNPVLQKGSVAGGDSYIARRRVDADLPQAEAEARVLGPRHHVGRFDPKNGIGRIIVIEGFGKESVEKEYHDGEILVETEPTSYELNALKFNKKRKEERHQRQLGSAVLRNDQSEGAVKVDSVVAYDNMVSMYWGQGKSMLKGLPTNIRMPTGLMEEIHWGIQSTEDRKDVYRVEAILEKGTAVNVTVWGNQTKSEVKYTGKLVAVYGDLQTRARSVSGELIEEKMKDLKAEYGPVYWIHNDSLVPTTTTTTTTTTSTTTTTTTTLRPSENNEDNNVQVQGDDSKANEASAFQKKNVSLASAVPVPSSSLMLLHSTPLLLLFFVLLRIT